MANSRINVIADVMEQLAEEDKAEAIELLVGHLSTTEDWFAFGEQKREEIFLVIGGCMKLLSDEHDGLSKAFGSIEGHYIFWTFLYHWLQPIAPRMLATVQGANPDLNATEAAVQIVGEPTKILVAKERQPRVPDSRIMRTVAAGTRVVRNTAGRAGQNTKILATKLSRKMKTRTPQPTADEVHNEERKKSLEAWNKECVLREQWNALGFDVREGATVYMASCLAATAAMDLLRQGEMHLRPYYKGFPKAERLRNKKIQVARHNVALRVAYNVYSNYLPNGRDPLIKAKEDVGEVVYDAVMADVFHAMNTYVFKEDTAKAVALVEKFESEAKKKKREALEAAKAAYSLKLFTELGFLN